jgi:hypothetical protein
MSNRRERSRKMKLYDYLVAFNDASYRPILPSHETRAYFHVY